MKYPASIMTVIVISMLSLVSFTYAKPPTTVNIYAWTDKTHYSPGEKGVLNIVVRNDRTDKDLILKNITITYPWFAYTGKKWEGNTTISNIDFTLTQNGGKIYTTNVDFNVPKDGRVALGMYGSTPQIKLDFAVDKFPHHYSSSTPLYIQSTPVYMSLEEMDSIVTLFTVQTVLIIVCTIIIAGTIFLSTRKPQATQRKTEKPE